jgi:hypothetical protein
VAQALALREQGRLLVRVEGRGVDRRHQLLEVGALALGGLAPPPRLGEGPVEPPQPPPQGRQPLGPGHDVGAGEGVQDGELARGAHQAAVLVLGREADQRPRQRGHGLARRRLAVDERARPPFGRHPAGDDDLVLVLGELPQRGRRVVLVEPLPEALGQGQGRLDQGVARPGAHGRGVGGRAGQQRQGLGEHGLAGAGLAGDRREPRRRRDLGPLDHDEVPHLERADHGRPNFSR